MSKHQVKRRGYTSEIECLDEQARVANLSTAAAPHEAPKLVLGRPSSPLRLLLERAEGSEVSLSVHDILHGGGTVSADQLVLQICDAHVEAQPFHLGPAEVGAEPGPLEPAPEVAFLADIAEAGQLDVKPLRTELHQEPSDGLRSPDRHDGNTLSLEIPATSLGERLERALIADPFDEYDRIHRTIFTKDQTLVRTTRPDGCDVVRIRLNQLVVPPDKEKEVVRDGVAAISG